ncbi:MAG: Ig-like domain-containing protein [Propionibacteriaceae bacterium]|nr:Ig-like domain-containing protein [Propionibacteriaceae bacterium]
MQSNSTLNVQKTNTGWLRTIAKPMAMITAFVMIMSTLILSQPPTAPDADAQVSGTWGWGWTTDTGTGARVLSAPMTPIDHHTLYGSSYGGGTNAPTGMSTTNGWVGYYATGGVAPTNGTVTLIANGNGGARLGPAGQWMSTLAIDADPYGQRGTKYAYMWSWAFDSTSTGLNGNYPTNIPTNNVLVYRVAEGETNPEVIPVPSPYFFNSSDPTNMSAYNYWSGGEIIQSTGEIFFSGGECSGLNLNYRMMVFDPESLNYNFSGRIQPKSGGDNIFNGTDGCGGTSYVASDMALDAKGQAYILVFSANGAPAYGLGSGNRLWLVRVEPNENGPWEYNLVTNLTRHPGESATGAAYTFTSTATVNMIYGMAFYEGILYATMFNNTALLAINPMTGQVKNVGGTGSGTLSPTYVQDMGSGQTAFVVEGVVYNDTEANGSIAGNSGIGGQRIGLYMKDQNDGQYVFQSSEVSGPAGDYTFLLGGPGDYIIRLVEPKIADVNATQTFASGGGTLNPATAKCIQGDITTKAGGACSGAVAQPHDDADLPTSDSASGTDKGTQPADMSYYTEIHVTSDREVAEANFGITTRGSYGDSAAGPATGPTAPAHINGVSPQIWLGSQLGSYAAPATDNTAHNSTDDGVFVESYAGNVLMANHAFLGSRDYTLVGTLGGTAVSTAKVSGWNTGVGNTTWNTAATWTPTVSGSTASGTWNPSVTSGTGQMHFRADVSTVPINTPTNASGDYYSTTRWVTPGEVEDYLVNIGNSVYTPAARTLAGTADFTIGGQAFPGTTTTLKYGTGVVATANTPVSMTATVPDTTWTVSEVLVKDFVTGELLDTLAFAPSANRLDWTFTYTPELNMDTVIEVVFAPNPDPEESELIMTPAYPDTQVVSLDITAKVIVRTSDRQLLPNVDVTFAKTSSDIVLTSTTCKTNAQGECFITLTSTQAKKYTDEISATVIVGTAPVQVSGSPATVEFVADVLSPESYFEIDPPADMSDESTWLVANGTDAYTGTLYAMDEFRNPIKNIDVSTISWTVPAGIDKSSVTNNGDGSYSITFTTENINKTAMASLKVGAQTIYADDANTVSELPIPFTYGEVSWEKSTLVVDHTTLGVGSTATATATIVDDFDNPIDGRDVNFSLAPVDPVGSHNAVIVPSPSVVQTDSQGKAVVTITNLKAETVALSAKVAEGNGAPDHINGSPVEITWEAGEPNAEESNFRVYITDTTKTKVIADGSESWTGELVARDENRNLLPNLTTEQLNKYIWAVTPAGVTISSPVFNAGNGVYTVQYTSTKAGAYTATLHLDGDQVDSDEAIAFVAGPVDPNKSKVSVDPNRTTAGSTVVVTVEVMDANENPISGLPNEAGTGVTIVGENPSLPDMTILNSDNPMQENPLGTYKFNTTSYKVGTFTVTATAMGVTINQKPTVEFIPGGVSAEHSSFAIEDNNRLADGVSKNSAKATARDQYDNPVPGARVYVEDKTTDLALMGELDPATQTATTDANGEAMVYWTSTKKGVYTAEGFIDDLRPPTGVMSDITFTTGDASAAKSEMSVYPNSPIVVGNSYTVTVTIRDNNNLQLEDERVEFTLDSGSLAELSETYCMTNRQGQCSVTVSSLLVTSAEISGKVTEGQNGLKHIEGNNDNTKRSPKTVAWEAGPLCLPPMTPTPVDPDNLTRVEVLTPGAEANGTAPETAKVYAYDCYGNPVSGVAITTTPSATHINATYRASTTDTDGLAYIDYRTSTKGQYTAIVNLNGTPAPRALSYGATTPRTDGQITLNFASGPVSPGNSTLAISPTTSQVVASNFTVTATLRDASNNPVEGIQVTFESGEGLNFNPQASCTSGADGTCQVTVTSTKATTYEIIGKVDIREISNRVSATFTPGPLCVTPTCNSRVEVTYGEAMADGEEHNIATVWAFDQYDNPIPNLDVASAMVTGETGLTIQSDIAPTNASGISTIWYSATVVREYRADVTVAGMTPKGSPITLYFGSGEGDPAHSQWSITPAGPLVVGEDPENTYTATAIVRDSGNILVPNAVVTFSVDPDGPVPGPNPSSWSCMTDLAGTCSITIHSTKAGTYNIGMRLRGTAVNYVGTTAATASRAWRADDVCSQAEGCDPVDPNLPAELRTRIEVTVNNSTANGIAQNRITAWGFDKWGNPVVGARVESTRVNAADPIAIQTGINPLGENGSSVIWYTSMVVGDYDVNVAIDDVRPVGSPATLTFTPGPVCVVEAGCEPIGPGTDPNKQTRVAVTTNNNKVDGPPNVVTAYAHDQTGNVVANVEFTFVKALASSNLVIEPTCTTAANGQCTVNATAKLAATHQARASVAGTELTNHGSPLDLTFLTGEICIIEAGCDPDPDTPADRWTRVARLDNNAHVLRGGTTPEERHMNVIGVYAFDKYGNPVAGAVFDLESDTSSLRFHGPATPTMSVTSTATVDPDRAQVYSMNDEDHFVKASIGGIELTQSGSPIEIWFVDAPVITNPTNGSTIGLSTAISGTATNSGSLVDVFVDGTKVCTATIQTDHTWACPPMKLDNGQHAITAQKHSRDGTKTSEISAPVTVQSVPLDMSILHPSRMPGETQVVSGYHFRPGEEVRLVVTSDPLDLGTQIADADGTVTFTFNIPQNMSGGTHTATLTGPDSGEIAKTFQVVIPVVPTGGTVVGQ